MSHEQKQESAEFRTREAHRRSFAQAWQDEGMGQLYAEALADAELSEAEARGAAEQRRKDAELSKAQLFCLREKEAADRTPQREDVRQWQEDQKQFFLPSLIEVVTEYAEWRDKKDAVEVAYYIDHRPGSACAPYAVRKLEQCAFPERAEPVYGRPTNVAAFTADAIARAFSKLPGRTSLDDEEGVMTTTVTVEELSSIISSEWNAHAAILEDRVKELEGALKEAAYALERVKDGERGGYNARNGKFVSLQMSDGERADIIHSEVTEDCEHALETLRAAIREGGEHD
ncbi:hypothetical protein [Asaia bogorensis]|uniref:hypothetical protein n=1 Tax=Asaia bogorensis TaxID=91915 RepID=UPI000EFD951D|nr:hypothetical protein [Asaia bogorensis]